MLQTSDENKGYVNDFISCLGKDLIPICKKSSRQGKLFGQKILQADAYPLIQQFDLPL